ncbi:glycoside hydrolase family protein [Sideroxydans sp.]
MKPLCWNKRGLIYSVDERLPWARTHAQIPTVDVLDEGQLRVLFSSRDESNRSLIAKMEVDAQNPANILAIQAEPILPLGQPGTFDDCGMMPSAIVGWRGLKYLYYIGWNVRNTVPYHNSVGLAVSEDGGQSYRRMFDGPVMDRTAEEPYFCATTCIRIENGIWRNWYLSCTGWEMLDGRMEPRYHLKYAESNDGIHWRRDGRVAIDYASPAEGGIVRASVRKDGSLYRMWYSYRSHADYRSARENSYRIGYAESADGLVWQRMDDLVGIEPSAAGWDSFMLAYPEVVDVGARRYMFYNGNGFGQTGFGYAEFAED